MKDFPTLSLPRKAFVKPSRHSLGSSFRQGWNMVNADLDWYPEGSIHWCLESNLMLAPYLPVEWIFKSSWAEFLSRFSRRVQCSAPHTKPSINQTVAKATHFAKGATFHAAKMKTTKFADIMFTTYARVCLFYHSWEDHWMLIDTIKMILGDFWDISGVKSWVKILETCLACWM